MKHFHEENLAKLQSVTTELLEPETGRVMGNIPNVNFIEGINQMPIQETIGEMLNNLPSKNSTCNEQSNETDFDNNCYSMGKEKQGKCNPILLPATKVADKKKKKEKDKQKGKDAGKEKPKPPPRLGLGLARPAAPLLMTMGQTMR